MWYCDTSVTKWLRKSQFSLVSFQALKNSSSQNSSRCTVHWDISWALMEKHCQRFHGQCIWQPGIHSVLLFLHTIFSGKECQNIWQWLRGITDIATDCMHKCQFLMCPSGVFSEHIMPMKCRIDNFGIKITSADMEDVTLFAVHINHFACSRGYTSLCFLFRTLVVWID